MRGLLMGAVVVGSVGLAWAEPAQVKPAEPAKVKPVAKGRSVVLWAPLKPATPAAAPVHGAAAANKRVLHKQGMTAYKAGNYSAAAKKFAAAMDETPSPDLIYQAAQAHRLKGDRARALELYEQYLELAPDGSAAPVCRWYVERLRATP